MSGCSWGFSGVKGRRIRELTSVVQKRFKFPEGSVELYAEKVANRGLCAIAQAESLRYKLLGGLAVRRCVAGRGSHRSDRQELGTSCTMLCTPWSKSSLASSICTSHSRRACTLHELARGFYPEGDCR